MRWRILTFTAILFLTPLVASSQQPAQPTCMRACSVNPITAPAACDCEAILNQETTPPEPAPPPAQPAAPTCEVACAVNPLTAPAGCNCNATISTGSGGPAPSNSDGGEPTAGDLFDEMIATWEAEIAQVENYLLIEKSKAAPLADIRYYERKSSGPGGSGSGGDEEGFVWIPNQELARRDLAANPSHGSGNSRTEIPPEVANDPTLFVNALGDVAEILGLGAAVGQAFDQEAAKIRGDAQESRDGIEGADTLGGLLSGLTKRQIAYFYEFYFEVGYGTYILETDEFVSVPDPGESSPFYQAMWNSGEWPPTSYVCHITRLDSTKEANLFNSFTYPTPYFLPTGSKIETGELWQCIVEGEWKPMRLSLTYLDPDLMRVTIQEENTRFVRRGPALIPRRIQKRILQGAQFFVDEVEREIRVNEGPPTQADLAGLVGETMDWPTFYSQGSP